MSAEASPVIAFDLTLPAPELTAELVDEFSVSGSEAVIADRIEAALRRYDHLEVLRDGDTIIARTNLGLPQRVVIAGHIDTVPVANNLPSRLDGQILHGRGTCDMKGGVAVGLRLAAQLSAPSRDVTYVFYDNEEVEAERNGLGRVSRHSPQWLEADFAVLMEPTSAVVEGGCNGTMRVRVTTRGEAAHSARAWMGHNAIHDAGPVLVRLASYEPRSVDVEGLVYREGLNAVGISGGIAGNVIPDVCHVDVNYRFAPDLNAEQAFAHLVDVFDGFEVTLVDAAAGARPGLHHPAAQAFIAAVGGEPKPKYGWTDVSRFSALGVPAVNYGPGDPSVAHRDDERVDVAEIEVCESRMLAWLSGA